MNHKKLNHIIKSRDFLTFESKKKFLKILKEHKKSYRSVICENELINRNVISKKFNTNSDFNAYVSQHRGLQILPQEKQAITNYQKAAPSELTDYYVKYESTDDFSNNNTTIIKKLKEGSQYCWTAFSKNESSSDRNTAVKEAEEPPTQPTPQNNNPPETPEESDNKNTIEITKSLPFTSETDGSKILSEFLIKLDI